MIVFRRAAQGGEIEPELIEALLTCLERHTVIAEPHRKGAAIDIEVRIDTINRNARAQREGARLSHRLFRRAREASDGECVGPTWSSGCRHSRATLWHCNGRTAQSVLLRSPVFSSELGNALRLHAEKRLLDEIAV